MEKKLRFGIVGCGTISAVHAAALQENARAELVSVFSRNQQKAKHLAREFNVKAFTGWNEFIEDDELDAVSICTPNGTHLDYGELAARAGKHVIVEKPIEVTIERGQTLIQVCRDSGVKLAVIFQNRFIPAIVQLKKRLDSGILGKIYQADAYVKWFRDQAYYDSGKWRGTIKLDGGGVLINQAIHTIDLLQWLVGDVESVFGQTATIGHERLEGEDIAVATLRFRHGALGVIQGATVISPPQARRIEIHGRNGSAILDGDHVRYEGIAVEGSEATSDVPAASGAGSPLQGFTSKHHHCQFEAISDAIAYGADPPVSGPESMRSLKIILAIYESARRDGSVELR